jgi:hypothetical protein
MFRLMRVAILREYNFMTYKVLKHTVVVGKWLSGTIKVL